MHNAQYCAFLDQEGMGSIHKIMFEHCKIVVSIDGPWMDARMNRRREGRREGGRVNIAYSHI